MLLGYLLGLEEGKLSEKERLDNERRKIDEEHLNALRAVYAWTPNACPWSRDL